MAKKNKNQVVTYKKSSLASQVKALGVDMTLKKSDIVAYLLEEQRIEASAELKVADTAIKEAEKALLDLQKKAQVLVVSEAIRLIKASAAKETPTGADFTHMDGSCHWRGDSACTGDRDGKVRVAMTFDRTPKMEEMERKVSAAFKKSVLITAGRGDFAERLHYLQSKQAECDISAQITQNILGSSKDGETLMALLKGIRVRVPKGK